MRTYLDYNRIAKIILENNKTNLHKKLCFNLLSKSLEIESNFFGTYYLLGLYYDDLKDFSNAEINYKKSIELNKTNSNRNSYLNLRSLYFFQKNVIKLHKLTKLFEENNNLTLIDYFTFDCSLKIYIKNKHSNLKFNFNNSKSIEHNYSQSHQDMFVLTVLNGKKNGTYLEIGAGNYFYGNNTLLLEEKFNWKGMGIDINKDHVLLYNQKRKNPCFLKDATKINYIQFLDSLNFPYEIDYLQLDCDPPEITYQTLLTIPFNVYKFAVITYEHDYYRDKTKSFQKKSKKYLESYGYVRIVNNICFDDYNSYEDWWVHPDLIDRNIINKMTCINDENKDSEKYLFNTFSYQ
jgi:hypothetical protein